MCRGPRPTLLALLLGLSGCAGYAAARRGEQAVQRGDYRAAVTAYEQAVREDPAQPRYREALRGARRGLAGQRFTEGVAALHRDDPEAAYAALRESVELEPRAEAVAQLGLAGEALSGRLEQEGRVLQVRARHAAAVATLRRAAGLTADPGRRAGLLQTSQQILDGLSARLQTHAAEAAHRGLYGLSWAEGRVAALVVGADTPPGDMTERLRYRVRVTGGGAGPLAGAVDAGVRRLLSGYALVTLDGGEAPHLSLDLRTNPAEIGTTAPEQQHKVERYVQRVDSVPNPRWAEVQAELRQVRLVQAGLVAEQQLTAEALRLAQMERDQAYARLDRSQQAAQRMAQVRQQELDARADSLLRRAARVRQQLAEVHQRLERTRGGHGPGPRPDGAEEQRLRAEQARLRGQMVEMERERALLAEERERLLRGDSGRLAAGRERVERREAELELVRQRAARIERDLAQAREDLSGVEQAAQQTPQMVPQPVYGELAYVETHVSRVGTLAVALRVEPPQPGETTWLNERVVVSDFARDAYHARGEPDLDIPAHVVSFPSDEELRGRLVAGAVRQVVAAVDRRLRTHGDRFVEAAARLTGEARVDQQVYVYHCRAVLSRIGDGEQARAELRQALGLILPESGTIVGLELERLDGR